MKITTGLKVLSLFAMAANASTVFSTSNEVFISDARNVANNRVRVFGQTDVVFNAIRPAPIEPATPSEPTTPPPSETDPSEVPVLDFPAAADGILRTFALFPSSDVDAAGAVTGFIEINDTKMPYILRDPSGAVLGRYSFSTRQEITASQVSDLEVFERTIEVDDLLYFADGGVAVVTQTSELVNGQVVTTIEGNLLTKTHIASGHLDVSVTNLHASSGEPTVFLSAGRAVMLRDASGKIVAQLTHVPGDLDSIRISPLTTQESAAFDDHVFIYDVPVFKEDGVALTITDVQEGQEINLPSALAPFFEENDIVPLRTGAGNLIQAITVGAASELYGPDQLETLRLAELECGSMLLLRKPSAQNPTGIAFTEHEWLRSRECEVKDAFTAAGLTYRGLINQYVEIAPNSDWAVVPVARTSSQFGSGIIDRAIDGNIQFRRDASNPNAARLNVWKRTHEGKVQYLIDDSSYGQGQVLMLADDGSTTEVLDADLFAAASLNIRVKIIGNIWSYRNPTVTDGVAAVDIEGNIINTAGVTLQGQMTGNIHASSLYYFNGFGGDNQPTVPPSVDGDVSVKSLQVVYREDLAGPLTGRLLLTDNIATNSLAPMAFQAQKDIISTISMELIGPITGDSLENPTRGQIYCSGRISVKNSVASDIYSKGDVFDQAQTHAGTSYQNLPYSPVLVGTYQQASSLLIFAAPDNLVFPELIYQVSFDQDANLVFTNQADGNDTFTENIPATLVNKTLLLGDIGAVPAAIIASYAALEEFLNPTQS